MRYKTSAGRFSSSRRLPFSVSRPSEKSDTACKIILDGLNRRVYIQYIQSAAVARGAKTEEGKMGTRINTVAAAEKLVTDLQSAWDAYNNLDRPTQRERKSGGKTRQALSDAVDLLAALVIGREVA